MHPFIHNFPSKPHSQILKLINKFTKACQWANTQLQAMVQPMAKMPQRKHDLHKPKPSVLRSPNIPLFAAKTTQVKLKTQIYT